MKYTIRQDVQVIHAVQYDGTAGGIGEISRFLQVHEQAMATAMPLDCDLGDGRKKLYCNVSYMDADNPRCHFIAPGEYFVLREDGTCFILPDKIFTEFYHPRESDACIDIS